MNTLEQLQPIDIQTREECNYVAFFLTLQCNQSCVYCINRHESGGPARKESRLSGEEWVSAANRLVLRPDLPLTLQGGEPTLHRDFFRIVQETRQEIQMDLLTNLRFDVDAFIDQVPIWRFNREAPYAPIRVSYHHGYCDPDELIQKTLRLMDAGFRVGVYGIDLPDAQAVKPIIHFGHRCIQKGIDFRMKEFLGDWNGTVFGTFKYKHSVSASALRSCECRTSELIAGPDGSVYRCHSDLYNHRAGIGHILDPELQLDQVMEFRPCNFYGDCNPCDVKVKTNRFQVFGHTSVEIRNIRELETG